MFHRAAALLLVLALATTARAESRIDLGERLDPASLLARVRGTGVRGREIAAPGARHRLLVPTLQVRLSPELLLRGGVGLARLRPHGFLPESSAAALSAGAAVTLWKRGALRVDLDVSAVRAGYHQGALADTTVLLALRSR